MKLTSLEKTYFDEFSKSFAKYGNEIPLKEWDHLSKVRKSLDISLKRSKEIIDAVQIIQSLEKKCLMRSLRRVKISRSSSEKV